MHIDSHIPPGQLLFTPQRPDPVPPGRDTPRPVPTPNGAEAGARHPLQDNEREEASRADARTRQDGDQENAARSGVRGGDNAAANDPFHPGASERVAAEVAPSRIGERIDVFA